mgnify:CR=1 FL=1
MLANFYIPRLSNEMKIAVHKNQLWRQIWYRNLDPVFSRFSRTVQILGVSIMLAKHFICMLGPIFSRLKKWICEKMKIK